MNTLRLRRKIASLGPQRTRRAIVPPFGALRPFSLFVHRTVVVPLERLAEAHTSSWLAQPMAIASAKMDAAQ